MRRPRLTALTAFTALAVAGPARAQLITGASGMAQPPSTQPQPADAALAPASLRQLGALERGKQLLLSAARADRLRGIARLGEDGSEEAIKALVGALDAGSPVRADPLAKLEAARALAGHALGEDARRGLAMVLGDPIEDGPDAALAALAQGTAALALARAGAGLLPAPPGKPAPAPSDDDSEPQSPEELALTPLVAEAIGDPGAAASAEHALTVYPPADLQVFQRGRENLPVAEIELLGAIGDARAIPILRRQLERKNRRAQKSAALALAKLADHRAEPVARGWLKEPRSTAAERLTACEVLLRLGSSDGPAELSKLLAAAATRGAAFALAEQWLSPLIVPTLAAILRTPVSIDDRRRAARLLARIRSPEGVAPLGQLLGDPELATIAVAGIARTPGDEARRALAEALAQSRGAARRMVLRAAIVRWCELAEELPALSAGLEAALASSEPADRAVGALGLALMGRKTVAELVASDRDEVTFSASAAALFLGGRALGDLAPLLSRALAQAERASPASLAACAPALLAKSDAVSADELAAWAEGGGAAAAVAAYRLASLDARSFRPRTTALLAGSDPAVRAMTALGLGQSPEPDAVSLLTVAYRREPDAWVRRALVRALSLRRERLRENILLLAARLDPDDETRGLAAAALRGARHDTPIGAVAGLRGAAWLSLVANDPDRPGSIRNRPVWALRPDGLALPFVSSADGVLLALGVPSFGETRFRVMPAR